MRQQILDRWEGGAKPALGAHTQFVKLNSIVEEYGDRDPFNDLVPGLLDFDYARRAR